MLQRIAENNFYLSAKKILICPCTTTILGWHWSSCTLSPSKRRLSVLATVQPPKTWSSMQSCIGLFKAVSRCVPQYVSLLSPLEDVIKGLEGSQKIIWDKALLHHFNAAQASLRNPQTLVIPRKSDQLILTVIASPMASALHCL